MGGKWMNWWIIRGRIYLERGNEFILKDRTTVRGTTLGQNMYKISADAVQVIYFRLWPIFPKSIFCLGQGSFGIA
jgi:hypothetical protein